MNKNSDNYFVATGSLPGLKGIAHRVLRRCGAGIVAYTAVAHAYRFKIYVKLTSLVSIVPLTTKLFLVYWRKLSTNFQIQSSLEPLNIQYNLSTQQAIEWSGVLLKIFDVGERMAVIRILLHLITDIPLRFGILPALKSSTHHSAIIFISPRLGASIINRMVDFNGLVWRSGSSIIISFVVLFMGVGLINMRSPSRFINLIELSKVILNLKNNG